MDTAQLEELRERLLHAQRAENLANRELNAFSTVNGGATFAELLARVQAARHLTKAVYEEWERTVRTFNSASHRNSGRVAHEMRPSNGHEDFDVSK
ncbi:MAG: hypothetical protein ABW186_10895 [Rhodanobacteraceae bacterium]